MRGARHLHLHIDFSAFNQQFITVKNYSYVYTIINDNSVNIDNLLHSKEYYLLSVTNSVLKEPRTIS